MACGTPDCGWRGIDHLQEHPCGRKRTPGEPCQFCGKPTPLDGSACPDCWTPIPDNHADAKALLARAGFSLGIREGREP